MFILNSILTYLHYQYKYREMVENNHLSNHKMEMHFVLVHFFLLVKAYFPMHQIFVILLKMVEEYLQFQC